MVPAGVTGKVIDELAPLLAAGDTIIDGGNTFYGDDIARARALARATASTTSTAVPAAAYGDSSAATAS